MDLVAVEGLKILFLLLLSSTVCVLLVSPDELMPYEPVEYLNGHLAPLEDTPQLWKEFVSMGAWKMENLTKAMKVNLKERIGQDVSVIFVREEAVLVEKLALGTQRDSTVKVPAANLLSLIGIALPILLEDYKFTVLTDQIGNLLKGRDREHAHLKGRESLSLLDILIKLPSKAGKVLEDTTLLQELESRGELALHVINTVLGPITTEAWLDAFLSVGMEMTRFSKEGQLVITSLNDLIEYTATIIHDTSVSDSVPKSDSYPLDDGKYLFGWWFNCQESLLPHLPPSTIFTLSPGLRIYVIPRLQLALIITHHGKTADRNIPLTDILKEDDQVWKQIYSVIDPTLDREDLEEQLTLAHAIKFVWPYVGFLFFIISGHVWVYWIFHGLWFVMTFFSKRGHIPRPKTAKQD